MTISGLFKSIGRVFKKVFNVVKKVAPIALAAGALVFGAGAALGLPALAGGWGGAVSSALGGLGISSTGTLGTILTSVGTQAGYGALIGGAGSALTGGDFAKGAGVGALAGAVTGGVSGAMSAAAPTAAQSVGMSTRSPTGLLGTSGSGATTAIANPANITGAATNGSAVTGAAGTVSGITSAAPAVADAAATATPTGLMGTLGNIASSPLLQSPVVGQTIAGLGQGLMTGMAAKDEAEAVRENQQRITDSYDVDPSAYDVAQQDTTDRMKPQDRWPSMQRTQTRRGRVRYNPATKQIEDVG